jgi:alpha-glucosidase (family GH31 glycosyl hydrolase)
VGVRRAGRGCAGARAALATLALAGLALAGCGSPAPPPLETTLGGLGVRVESRPARLVITAPDGAVLLDGLPGGKAGSAETPPHVAAAVRHAEATYEMSFGSFRITEPDPGPWRGVTELVDATESAGVVTFGLKGEGGRLGDATISSDGDGRLAITLTAAPVDVTRVSVAFACPGRPGQPPAFLGFGGQSWDVDHGGKTVPLWVQEDGLGKEATDDYDLGLWQVTGRRHSTHTPMPIYLSDQGYALLLETNVRSTFAMCSESTEVVRIEVWEPVMRLRLFYGPSPREALTRLTAHLGRPAVPPAFAFAPWHDAIFGSANVRRVAQKLRDEGIPSSVIWTEDWRGGADDGAGYTLSEEWDVSRDLYPDFEQLAADLHGLGYKLLTYNNTFLTSDASIYAEAVSLGHSIKTASGDPYLFVSGKFVDTSLVDLSSPAAWAWTKEHYARGLALGADGWMADFAEWLPTDAVLASGESAALRHNLYPVDFQRLNREVLDEAFAADGVERLFFVRSAYLGSQPLVSVVWAGDQQTDFSPGDGLPSVIPMGIGLGVTGFPYYGHDIGGYMSQFAKPTTKELWFRWASLGALSPVMRTHHGKSARKNWSWESDAETIAHMKRWATLHLRLFPYLWALAHEAAQTGVPMMRAIALEHPTWRDGWRLDDQYLLGDRILVAPVVTEGATTRTVRLPEGTWYPLLASAASPGDDAVVVTPGFGEVEVAAPVEECPAFVPAGTVLVLLPEGVDTVVAADAASGAVTLADAGDDREVWLYPGGEGAFAEVGGLAYTWSATGLEWPTITATWNGAPATFTSGAVTVTGPGTLVVEGASGTSGTLVVDGGAPDRVLTVRLRRVPPT